MPVGVEIRPAIITDAAAIARLGAEFASYLRAVGDDSASAVDEAIVLRDGFGSSPAFSGLVAEADGEIVGYLLYHPGYDTDYATRTLHVVDLYVTERWRRHGIGRALMKRAAQICREMGGTQLFWSVYVPNRMARDFYERLGARYTRDLLFMRWEVGT